MTDTVLLVAEELLRHFAHAGITLRSLAKAVLECTPVDLDGNALAWPPASKLRLRHLVRQVVRSATWPDEPPVPGLNIMSTVAAERATHAAMFSRHREGTAVMMTSAQVEEVYKAVAEFLRPHLELDVERLLMNSVQADGFFSSYRGDGVEGIEANLVAASRATASSPLRRIADEPFEHHRLALWRMTNQALACEGEQVTDIHAVLLDNLNRQAAYARLRHVALMPQTHEATLARTLDAYDELGLELGAALRAAVLEHRLSTRLLEEGLVLLQLQELEVRHDLRGHGLGMRMLHRALALGMKDLRPQPRVFAVAVKPMQYDFPLQGLPPDMLLEALDATSRVHQLLEVCRPQDAVESLRGTEPLYLGVDGRATGTHIEQLMLLAEG